MLYFPGTRIVQSIEYPVASGATVTQEGAPLAWSITGNGVQPSLGTSADRFAGISLNQQYSPVTLPYVENDVVPSTGAATITLANTPASGTLYIYNLTNATVQTAGTPGSTDNTYSISGNVVTLNTARAGNSLYIGYSYSPTTQQVLGLQGMAPPVPRLPLTWAAPVSSSRVSSTPPATIPRSTGAATVRLRPPSTSAPASSLLVGRVPPSTPSSSPSPRCPRPSWACGSALNQKQPN